MNRAEFNKLLDVVCKDIDEKGGVFEGACDSEGKRSGDIRTIAAVALMAVDRYYSNMTKLESERKDL